MLGRFTLPRIPPTFVPLTMVPSKPNFARVSDSTLYPSTSKPAKPPIFTSAALDALLILTSERRYVLGRLFLPFTITPRMPPRETIVVPVIEASADTVLLDIITVAPYPLKHPLPATTPACTESAAATSVAMTAELVMVTFDNVDE